MTPPAPHRGLSACPGCGVVLPLVDGPTHRYMVSSSACWETFGRILAKEFGDPSHWPAHTLTVDTFAAQHPGRESDQTRRSVAFHLVGLCLVVERGMDPAASGWLRQKSPGAHKALPCLTPPAHLGAVTTADVVRAASAEEHVALVRRWAASVWEAWSPHHARVQAWADRVGSQSWADIPGSEV